MGFTNFHEGASRTGIWRSWVSVGVYEIPTDEGDIWFGISEDSEMHARMTRIMCMRYEQR